jgi:hypothetical protein
VLLLSLSTGIITQAEYARESASKQVNSGVLSRDSANASTSLYWLPALSNASATNESARPMLR